MFKTWLMFFQILSVTAKFTSDQIISLPGWKGDLPSMQYSGYLKASNTSFLHYWLVECENTPESAPVVIWFNGGPGCSSLDGFFYEHGPFEVDVTDNSKLNLRPTRWSQIANVLYIESPVGVGFSYSDISDYELNDDRAAFENRRAVESFYEKFPEFLNNDLFITGESYAGIYVPTLAEAILLGEADKTYTGAKLTGIAVGNGCTGNEIGICGWGPQGTYYEWKYLTQTAFLPSDLKNSIDASCDWKAASVNKKNSLSAKCISLLEIASTKIGQVNQYNVYGDCIFNSGCDNDHAQSKPLEAFAISHGKVPERPFLSEYMTSSQGDGDEDSEKFLGKRIQPLRRIIVNGPDACIDSAAASAYLNDPEVMKAIHVRDPGFCWSVCKSAPGWKYTSTRKNLPADTYPLLISKIEVVIFNGDWDACVPYTDNEAWTTAMGFDVKRHWHPWTYTSTSGNQNQVAGYAVSYDVHHLGGGSFQFVTVKGGRHEVPESSPAQALELLRHLINKTPF